MYSVDNIE